MTAPQINSEQLRDHIERIRAADLFARSKAMARLFEFLAARSLGGTAPKEIEIAIDVFGKDASFAAVQNAMVRVNIHKLRRRLEEYYEEFGSADHRCLVIPRGEYRLALQDASTPIAIEESETEVIEPASESVQTFPNDTTHARRYWAVGGVLLVLLVNALIWAALRPAVSSTTREINAVRSNPIWRDINDDNLPVYVAVGDYYIFGELDDTTMNLRRLVREFDINSRNDLEQFLKNNPQLSDRYMDVSLQYLPISAGYALLNIVPLLETNAQRPRQVQVILASDLTPAMIKSAHVIYIGLLSGLGILRDIAFVDSQFEFGESYDELIDRKTGEHYMSEAGGVVESRTKYLDYGYFSTVIGPGNNRIVILTGTRDVAAIHAAEAVAHPQSIQELVQKSGATENFEALYAVEALDHTSLGGRLLLTGRLAKLDVEEATPPKEANAEVAE